MPVTSITSISDKPILICDHIESLPIDLKINIFSFIPNYAPKLACVCRAWKQLVTDVKSWKVFAERATGSTIPQSPGSECRRFFTRRIGLAQSFQSNHSITINRNFSLPVWHLTYVDETQTTYFIFLNHHEKWPITYKKILIWNPITEKEPKILFIHEQMINIWEVAQIRFSPEKEKRHYLICSSYNGSKYSLFFIDLKSKEVTQGPTIGSGDACVFFFDHEEKPYLLIHQDNNALGQVERGKFDVWSLQDNTHVHTLGVKGYSHHSFNKNPLHFFKSAEGAPCVVIHNYETHSKAVYDLISNKQVAILYDVFSQEEMAASNIQPFDRKGGSTCHTIVRDPITGKNFILILNKNEIGVWNTNSWTQEPSLIGEFTKCCLLYSITVGVKSYVVATIEKEYSENNSDMMSECVQIWDFSSRQLIFKRTLFVGDAHKTSFLTDHRRSQNRYFTPILRVAAFPHRVAAFPHREDYLLLYDNLHVYRLHLKSDIDPNTGFVPFDKIEIPKETVLGFASFHHHFLGVAYLLFEDHWNNYKDVLDPTVAKTKVIDLGAFEVNKISSQQGPQPPIPNHLPSKPEPLSWLQIFTWPFKAAY